jgi:elongation factor P
VQTPVTFRAGDKVGSPDVEDKDGQFLFAAGDTYTFMDPKSYEQYEINKEMLGDSALFLVDGMNVQILFYGGRAVSVDLPNSVVLQIVECEPAVKGDTATNATKKAKLSTGHTVNVPLFMKEGENVKVDTRSGEYIERA